MKKAITTVIMMMVCLVMVFATVAAADQQQGDGEGDRACITVIKEGWATACIEGYEYFVTYEKRGCMVYMIPVVQKMRNVYRKNGTIKGVEAIECNNNE